MKAGIELRRQRAAREFLALVERVVSDFTPHPTSPEIPIAPRFTPTAPLAKFAGSSRLPRDLSRGLIRLVWWGGPGSSTTWEVNAFDLRVGVSVFWIETDFGDEEKPDDSRHIIATGSGESSDHRFIELLFASN